MSTKRASILLAEDEAISALYLRQLIERMGHVVVAVVKEGEHAVREAERTRIDLLIFDVQLDDDMDGIEAAEAIDSGIPVIFYTAYSDASTLRRARCLNPVAVLEKPVHESVLRAAIEKGLAVCNEHGVRLTKKRGRL